MINEGPKNKNIYAVLNSFNQKLGEVPKYSIAFVSPEENAVFVKMLYDEHVELPPSEDEMAWNHIVNSEQNYAMAKVIVSEVSGKTQFFQYFSNIYINGYMMPDEEKAKHFGETHDNLFGRDFILSCRGTGIFVTVGNCFLRKAIKMAEDKLESTRQSINKACSIDEIKENAKQLVRACNFLELLQKAETQKKGEKNG